MRKTIAPLLSFLAALVMSQVVQAQSVSKTFHDWSVVCDNVKTCMAFSTSARSEGGLVVRPRGLGEDVSEGWLSIERGAGRETTARILLSRPDLSQVTLSSTAEIHLVGTNGLLVPRGVFAATLGDSGAIEIPRSLNTQFLRVARGASHAILVVGQVKRPVFFLSLSGLVASGRYIDAHQGRTNTGGALIDVGRLNNTRVPAAPPLPLTAAFAFTKRANATPPPFLLSRRQEDCDDSERFDPGGRGIEAFNIGQGRTLWSVPCGAGAYNIWNRFYIVPARGALMRAQFLRIVAVEGLDDINITNAIVDPSKGTITSFSKGRGLGDCGTDETFAWNGRDFVLAQSREMVPCGGIMPEFWPSVYNSQITKVATR